MLDIIFIKEGKTPNKYIKNHRIELKPDVPYSHSRHKPWDDFTFKTSFSATLFFKDKEYDLPHIKILLEDTQSTHEYFIKYLETLQSRYFKFPIKDIKYVSLATDIEFYQTLRLKMLRT